MPRYVIAEWNSRYEVSTKGREWSDGETKRRGPLEYIRLKVHGHSQGLGWRRLLAVAGKDSAAVFGIFCKLLELAADSERENRGYLEDSETTPLSFVLGLPEPQVKLALDVCCQLGWIVCETPANPPPETPGISRENPEAKEKGPARKFVPPTLEDVRQYIADNPELSNVDAETFFKGMHDGGWIDTRGNPVRNWKLKIRTWSTHHVGTAKAGANHFPGRDILEQNYGTLLDPIADTTQKL